MLNFDFLKTEVFQIEQNGSKATMYFYLIILTNIYKQKITRSSASVNKLKFEISYQ